MARTSHTAAATEAGRPDVATCFVAVWEQASKFGGKTFWKQISGTTTGGMRFRNVPVEIPRDEYILHLEQSLKNGTATHFPRSEAERDEMLKTLRTLYESVSEVTTSRLLPNGTRENVTRIIGRASIEILDTALCDEAIARLTAKAKA